MEFYHEPIMLKEILEGLQISPSGLYIDCTIGGAGHSENIVKKLSKNGLLIGLDKDIEAINYSLERLSKVANVGVMFFDCENNMLYDRNKNLISDKFFCHSENVDIDQQLCKLEFRDNIKQYLKENLKQKYNNDLPQVVLIKTDYNDFSKVCELFCLKKVDGVLVDLGISSHQIDEPSRGFSFLRDGKLDMRMDQQQTKTAYDVVNYYSEQNLQRILKEYGEEDFAHLISKVICQTRESKKIETTFELKNIIEGCLPKKYVYNCGGASKKTFQAIRIEVNGELDRLLNTFQFLIDLLDADAKMAVLTFHSLEDRIAKNIFKDCATGCICPPKCPKCICGHKQTVKLINKKPIEASESEKQKNSRSTCAKLRIVEKL